MNHQPRLRTLLFVALAALAASSGVSATAFGFALDPFYAGSYSAMDLGPVAGVPNPYGGLTFKYDDPNKLILGGTANQVGGALYSVDLVRGLDNHITGFAGGGSFFAEADYNDGGVVYGPGNVLFLARWPANELGQTKPGSTVTDKIIDMSQFGVSGSSLAALNFVPSTFGGAGRLKMVSWDEGNWYDATFAPDGNGTYDITGVTQNPAATLPGGPEGFVYISQSSPLFATPSLLISDYSEGRVDAYEVDGNGDPLVGTRRQFMSDLTGAEGAVFDPLTGDFLFSTFGTDQDHIVIVQGFTPPPPPVPEPSTLALLGLGLVGLGVSRRRPRSV